MRAPEGFRSLASMLVAAKEMPGSEPPAVTVEHVSPPEDSEYAHACEGLLRDVRLFHACLLEGVEEALEILVGNIAVDVVGRELLLAPADLASIVDRVLQQYLAERPLLVRVHPDDIPSVASLGIEIAADESLRRGDAAVDLQCGSIDASLGVRLRDVISAAFA